MVVPYLSMYVLFLLPPLQLDTQELWRLADRLVVATLLGGAFLFAFPTAIGFPESHDAGIFQGAYDRIYAVDSPFNAVPSLHVVYTATILMALRAAASDGLRRVYSPWLVIVCASTVLTHRHHLLDVVAGLALALCVGRAMATAPRPLLLPSSINQEASPCE
jgi:membrane-associated phospholipid phosphatase